MSEYTIKVDSIFISKCNEEDIINRDMVIIIQDAYKLITFNKFMRETFSYIETYLYQFRKKSDKFLDKYKQLELTNISHKGIEIDKIYNVKIPVETGECSMSKIIGYNKESNLIFFRPVHGIDNLNNEQIVSPKVIGMNVDKFIYSHNVEIPKVPI